ncbi:MAG: hypothetical protein J0M11_03645 [Anaerolineae bacterium]|nr:hypothetical protein [Anaerolineae bacterium]
MFQSNIDPIRERIAELENSPIFDALEWSKVLADLETAGRLSALADARRRMETAQNNAVCIAAFLMPTAKEAVLA